MEKISQFQMKDVINIFNGRKLGYINDIEIDLDSGKITAIVVTSGNQFLGFFNRNEETVIRWQNILKIGEDVILVRYDDSSNFAIPDGSD